ncbi:MAG: hypothetical protein IPO27_07575 [Bacteroidetes bacterium]|nr:hypothetical protein [Bacteroidota bacterium]
MPTAVPKGTATVTQPSQLFVFVNGTNPACNGANSGSATAIAIGGAAPYSYSWNTVPVKTTAIATGLGVGTYTVTITDANGCTATASVTLTAPPSLNVTSKKTNVSCHGGSNGTITVVPTGGTAPYSYLWSNGKTTKFVIGLAAGTYTVTVTDAGGCTKTLSVVITQPSALLALYTVTNVSCNGGSNGAIDLSVTGGTPGYTYLWSTGATTQDITGVMAGMYNVTIKDKRGCISNAMVVITQANAMIVSITPKNPKCNGAANGQATASVSGGVTPYSYSWSSGQTTASATGLAAGTYTVTITDANGCTKTQSVTLTQPAVLSCSANVLQTITCNGGLGKIGVTVTGGTPGYTYTWNTVPVATTAIVNNVGAGTYTVIVKDKNNCTTSCSVTLGQPAAITCDPLTITAVSCNGGNDGTATVSGVTGGTGPYTYLWNTSVAQTTATATGLSAGTYTVTITDANGCTKTASVVVTQPTGIMAAFTTTQPTCQTGIGTATVTASGGTMPYSYLWSDGQTTATAVNLPAGTYSVTVTDANGCTAQLTGIIINQGSTITANPLTGVNVLCNGGNNGSATISGITGGTAPYSISWNTVPGQGTMTATGLTAGTYTVTVTDAQGCIYTASIEITEPLTPVTASIPTVVPITCTGGGTASATAQGAGGTPAYTYLWSDGQTGATATGLVPGGYIVTVTDANGCTASQFNHNSTG